MGFNSNQETKSLRDAFYRKIDYLSAVLSKTARHELSHHAPNHTSLSPLYQLVG
jgi:hypothetical protein